MLSNVNGMKKDFIRIISLFCFLGFFNSAKGQETYDYISSGYYQVIYEAMVEYQSGDEDIAYEKLQEAEKRCPLIQQPNCFEISAYIDLLIKKNEIAKAQKYMLLLAEEYGFGVEHFDYLRYLSVIKERKDWPVLEKKIQAFYKQFYTEEKAALMKEIVQMGIEDQKVRKGLVHPLNDRQKLMLKKTDSINAKKLKVINDTYGFPLNMKFYGRENNERASCLSTIVLHLSSYFDIKDSLYLYVQQGKCPPFLLANVVDRECRSEKKPYIYRAAFNADAKKILEPENLDKRRMEIGMPSLEMELKLLKRR